MRTLTFLLVFLCLAWRASAQDEVAQTDSMAVEETVRIFKDPRLDVLSKRPPLMAKLAEEKKEMVNYKPLVSTDGKKKVTGSIYTAKGFRVVIFSGPDRAQAMQAKNLFSRNFPGIPSYVSYNVPSYKIKVGNFESRAEANEFLRRIGRAFPTSFIVPDIVTIKNINVTY
jgi:hypothetical protein